MSAITFSGFNQIDFNVILKAVMEQERQPLVTLQQRRSALEVQKEAFGALASRLSALEAASASLADASAFGARSIQVGDPTVLGVAGGGTTPAGTYEVVVSELARSQVTTTADSLADRDATAVATGGTLIIGGVPVLVSGTVTLQGLVEAINNTPDIPVTASIVSAGGLYKMVLTGKSTGQAGAFTVENGLTGGTGLAFSATNAQEARDAAATVNGVAVTSATNTLEGVIPGATVTLLKRTETPVAVTVGRDTEAVAKALESFVAAYNDLVSFFDEQGQSAAQNKSGSIARDSMMRSLRASLREGLNRQFATEGPLQYLSQVGIEFERTGKISFDRATFDVASQDLAGLQAFLAGEGATGAFDAVRSVVREYVGLIPGVRLRVDDEMQRLDDRMAAMEARLAIRQAALQREYAAADRIMSSLTSQMGSLASLNSQYSQF